MTYDEIDTCFGKLDRTAASCLSLPKIAQRLASHLLKVPETQAQALPKAINEARNCLDPAASAVI